MLVELNQTMLPEGELLPAQEEAILKRVDQIQQQEGLMLDELQRKAVLESVRNSILILTGGPGTGKTTTINTIIRYFEGEGLDLYLAAPTGRAAKRMTEATGYEARTIHRMLELSGAMPESGKKASFERNEDNPLEADVIIVDEMSMVDIHLFQSLLKAVSPGTRLILVGDVNQLPSVGPGQVLADLIASEVFPVVCLQKIFRQAQESDIVVNAHRINKGEQIALTNKSRDFFFSGEEQCPCYLQAYGAADRRDAAEICKGFAVRYPGADADAERQPWCGDVKRRTAELFKSSVGGQKEVQLGDTLFREGTR